MGGHFRSPIADCVCYPIGSISWLRSERLCALWIGVDAAITWQHQKSADFVLIEYYFVGYVKSKPVVS